MKKYLHMIGHKYIINSVNTENKINRKENKDKMVSNYYAFATLEEMLAMSEEKQKAVYDFITMLNDLKKEGFKMKEPQEAAKPIAEDVYNCNDTMRMLGKQNVERYIDNEEVSKSIQDITQARGYDLKRNFDLIFDVFLYGCTIGRREERQKKKATAKPTK